MDAIYKSLKGKTVIVVGTGSLGGAIVNDFLEQGCKVYGIDNNQDTLDNLSNKYSEYGYLFQPQLADVTEVQDFETILKTIGDNEETPIHSFVYTAGLGVSSEPDSFKDRLPEELFQLNVFGLMYGIRAISEYLDKGSSIIATGSLNATRPEHGMSMYDTTKAAIHQYMKTASLHFGPKGIRVNVVAPGYIHTTQTETEMEDSITKKRIEDSTTLGYIGEPKDVSSVVIFLASDASNYLTGEVIHVDGGLADAQYPAIKKQIDNI